MKTCSSCRKLLPIECFNKHPHASFGVTNKCKECSKAYNKKHYSENREKYILNSKEWIANNKERAKEHFANSKKKARITHPHRKIAENTARVEYVKRATPAWADKEMIREAYHLAKLREKMVGGKWHVDHVIPLRGKTVCGLHVENNLQVIPATQNVRKHAKFHAE